MFAPSQNPPVQLENVEREHFANASQFLGAIRIAPFQLQTCELFEGLCRRCESDLDALRIVGDQAVKIGQAALEDDGEVASLVALLLAECECDQPGTSEQSLALLSHESPEIRQAAGWGLRLASFRHVEPHLRALLGKPRWDFASAAALDILAFHRLPVQAELGAPRDVEGDEIAWLLAEAGGRMRGAWKATHLKQFLGHASPRVREAALRASARCGLPELPAFCREATLNSAPLEAIEFLGVVGFPEDLSRLQRAAQSAAAALQPERGSSSRSSRGNEAQTSSESPGQVRDQSLLTSAATVSQVGSGPQSPSGQETRALEVGKAALNGLGRLGLPAAVPFLLEFLSHPELADSAAAAIERITGQEVPRGAPPEPPPGLTEDELDLWEPKPPVDAPRARDWWRASAAHFDPAKRYQTGLCVSDTPLGPVFDQLPLAIRYDVYLRERALTPGTPDWELETWTWRQRNPTA